MNLSELQQKYGPRFMKFEPDPNCKFCHGDGEVKTQSAKVPMRACVCVFIQHDFAGQVQKLINTVDQTEVIQKLVDLRETGEAQAIINSDEHAMREAVVSMKLRNKS